MATGLREKGWAYGLRDKFFGSQPQVIEPGKESELPVLQGDEYVQDLNKRNGGLTPGRSEEETLALKNLIDRISSGDLDEQSVQVIAHRNPNARGYLTQALEKRNQTQAVPNITSQYFNRPDLAPVSEINLGQAGFPKTEVSPAQPQQDDPINAVRRLIQVGTPEALTAANQIASLYGVGNKAKSTVPRTRRIERGNDVIYQEHDTESGDWTEVGRAPKGVGQDFRNAKDLRKEYIAQSKPFIDVRDSYSRIQTSSQNPSPAGDLSLIFNYMKMLDPQSVVRESEFAVAANAAPLMQRLGLDFNKLKNVWEGQKLSDGQRADFVKRASELYKAQLANQEFNEKQYRDLAMRSGVDPKDVVIDYRYSAPKTEEKKDKPEKDTPQSKLLRLLREK